MLECAGCGEEMKVKESCNGCKSCNVCCEC